MLRRAAARPSGAVVFAYSMSGPGQYGVVDVGPNGEVVRRSSKSPKVPPSSYAVIGFNFYDEQVSDIAAAP